MATAYIGLGSNLGDRSAYLTAALVALEREPVSLISVSPLYETAPVGGPPQDHFLNACASVDTALPPTALLRRLQTVEAALGRQRLERWGPRTIDLDLLLYDEVLMRSPVLELPHPRLAERDFVLQPLSVIAPHIKVPGTGKSVLRLLVERPPAADLKLYRAFWYSG